MKTSILAIAVLSTLAIAGFASSAARADAMDDGKASKQADSRKHDKQSPSAMFDSLDSNKDGKLSRDELKDHPTLSAKFDDIDANKDGGITQDEMRAFHRVHSEAMREKHDVMKSLDKNADGKLSRDEASGNAKLSKVFDRADADKDGQLTQEELQNYRKAMQDKARTAK
jgi:Ca2+-binding EF-hand superfamily protein